MAFKVAWFIGLCSLLLGYGVNVEASHNVFLHLQSFQNTTATHQPYRTGYHFQPAKNWINDPNGPMIYKGIYHLLYQYNPNGSVWGNIVWAHATSTDLVNWVHHEPAIKPSIESDINGCWSGSTTILPGDKPAILYTGIDPQKNQVQNLAIPKNLSDPFLVEWTKPPQNPVMTPIDGINASSFRDPTTAWTGPDGEWRVIIGSKIDREGKAIMYKSKDFIKWERVDHPLYSAKKTGMWECPDFFPVSVNSEDGLDTSATGPHVKHVFKVSLDDTRHEYYTIGTYNLKKDKYVPNKGFIDSDSGLRYDYGKFYASKTFFDNSKNRRILWGWINESTTPHADVKKGWSGVQAIPRKIWLHASGKQLVQWPVEEIEKLREKQVNLQTTHLKKGSVVEVSGVTGSQADVDVSFDLTKILKNAEKMDPSWDSPQLLCSQKGASVEGSFGPFGLLVLASKGLKEQTAIFFRVFKDQKKYVVLMCSDQSRSSLGKQLDETTYGAFLDLDPLQEQLSLRSLIDHSIVESFGGDGRVCITSRVYPKKAIYEKAHLYVFNNGTEDIKISKLSAWSMKKAEIAN